MKMACADFAFPLLKHEDALRLIAMMGFDAVDIGLLEGRAHLRPREQFEDIAGNARRLRNRLDQFGLMVADVFLQTAPDFTVTAVNHPDKEIRAFAGDMFRKTLDYAAVCGARHVTLLPGVHFASEPREASLERSAEELSWRLDAAKRYGICVAVEAHIGSIAQSPEEAYELLERTPGLTLSLDYSHFVRLGIPDARVAPLLKHASHFHARGAAPGKLQTVLSENAINYPEIVKQLKALGYGGCMCVEYTWNEWEMCNRTDNVSESLLLRALLLREWNKE